MALLLEFDLSGAKLTAIFQSDNARGESIRPEKLPFVGKKSGKVSSFQAGVTLQEANIYSGPGIRRNRKRAKKRRSKNKVKWKHLTVFPEKNSHFVSPLETANGETLQNIIRQGKYEKPYFGTDCI